MPQIKKIIDKNGNEMFYRDGKLMKKADVTDEIRSQAVGPESQPSQEPVAADTQNHENGVAPGTEATPPVEEDDQPELDESGEESAPVRKEEDAVVEGPELPVSYGAPQMSTPGMGYKMNKQGQTLSIFGNDVSQTVKFVAGEMVPLTHEEHATKSDQEIIEQLKKIKKL